MWSCDRHAISVGTVKKQWSVHQKPTPTTLAPGRSSASSEYSSKHSRKHRSIAEHIKHRSMHVPRMSEGGYADVTLTTGAYSGMQGHAPTHPQG